MLLGFIYLFIYLFIFFFGGGGVKIFQLRQSDERGCTMLLGFIRGGGGEMMKVKTIFGTNTLGPPRMYAPS